MNSTFTRSSHVAFFVLCLASAASAATLANLELIPDGSADPPGDRLAFVPLLAAKEMEATCEIRAFTVDSDRRHSQAVQARGNNDRDAHGSLVITRNIKREDRSAERFGVVVPYAELDLPVGTHWLGYAVSVKGANLEPFVVATRLTQVVVSETPRSQMRVQLRSARESVDTHEQAALVGGAPGQKGTEAVRKSITVSTPKVSSEIKTSDVKVSIPGGFQRRVPPREITRGDDADYADRDQLSAAGTALVSLASIATAPLATAKSNDPRLVYFATNRAVAKTSTPSRPMFSSDPGAELSTGQCLVNIPVQHQRGSLEQPNFWSIADPKKHFLVQRTQLIPSDQVFRQATSDDLLLYIHGFNTEFDFAVLRAAQLRYDLQFPGTAMAMCWPSAGSMGAYAQDRENAGKSAEHLANLLEALVTSARQAREGGQPPKLHLLAHSLGNYVLLNAIYKLHSRGVFADNDHLFQQVILAAPMSAHWSSTTSCHL